LGCVELIVRWRGLQLGWERGTGQRGTRATTTSCTCGSSNSTSQPGCPPRRPHADGQRCNAGHPPAPRRWSLPPSFAAACRAPRPPPAYSWLRGHRCRYTFPWAFSLVSGLLSANNTFPDHHGERHPLASMIPIPATTCTATTGSSAGMALTQPGAVSDDEHGKRCVATRGLAGAYGRRPGAILQQCLSPARAAGISSCGAETRVGIPVDVQGGRRT